MIVQGVTKPVTISDVLHVPGLTGSLISVMQLQDRGITVSTQSFPNQGLTISLDGKVIGAAHRVGRAYLLSTELLAQEMACPAIEQGNAELQHRRFGHLSYSSLQGIETVTTGLDGPVGPLTEDCKACIMAKAVRVIRRETPERVSVPLGRVWVDWWGPFSVPSLGGHTNMLVIVDEATRKVWVLFGSRREF
jgi:hypothetical protein